MDPRRWFRSISFACTLALFAAAGCSPPPAPDDSEPDGGSTTETDASDAGEGTGDGHGSRTGPCWDFASADDAGTTGGGQTGDAEAAGQGDTGDAGDAGAPEESVEPVHPAFSYKSQYDLRFETFEFDSGSPGYDANIFLEDYLDQSREFPIVVLLRLKKLRPEEGTALLRGGAGLKVDKSCNPSETECKYEWDPESPERFNEVEFDARTGELTGGLESLDFVGTNKLSEDNINKFTLRIHDIEFSEAYLRPTGDGCAVRVDEGHVEGYITEEEAKEAKVKLSDSSDPIPISDLLDTDKLNYDSDDDGTDDAWWLSATFSATQAEIVD